MDFKCRLVLCPIITDMPIRPIQHELEDISRAKFQLALPQNWVYRDKYKDYGIDGEVELFDDNRKALGLVFWIQLKATASKKESTRMNVDLRIDTLRYYKKLDIPVLLVRYSSYKDSLYVKWVNNVDLFFVKENAKTFRIKLTEKNLWDSTSAEKIEKRLSNLRKLKSGFFNFPLPLTLEIKKEEINGFSKGILISQVRRNLQQFSDFVEYKDIQDESIVEVNLDNEELKLNICDLCGCSFHSINLRKKEKFVEGISQDILLGIATSMIQIGQIEYCGRIIFDNSLQERLLEKKELLTYILPPLFQTSYFNKVIDLVGKIMNDDSSIETDLITIVNILCSSTSKNKLRNNAIEKFFQSRLQRSINNQDDTQIGISHYNLGNHYRGRGLYLKSIHHYKLAKRYASIYLNQHYYFSELAGVLFLSEKFKISSKLYLKSIELGAPKLTKALYADALLFSGEYEKSKGAFFDYLNSTDSPNEEFLLKAICMESLVNEMNIKKQIRNREKANNLADLSKLKNDINPKTKLEKAFEQDLLSGLAWFNLGIIHSENMEYDQAAFCFTMAALVQTNDIEAWMNATLCAFNSENEYGLIHLIIRTAYFFNREEYLEALYSRLEAQNKSKQIEALIEMIEKILPEQGKKERIPTVRILNEHGIFENIFEK